MTVFWGCDPFLGEEAVLRSLPRPSQLEEVVLRSSQLQNRAIATGVDMSGPWRALSPTYVRYYIHDACALSEFAHVEGVRVDDLLRIFHEQTTRPSIPARMVRSRSTTRTR